MLQEISISTAAHAVEIGGAAVVVLSAYFAVKYRTTSMSKDLAGLKKELKDSIALFSTTATNLQVLAENHRIVSDNTVRLLDNMNRRIEANEKTVAELVASNALMRAILTAKGMLK